jgi:hypothetical protein
MDDLDRLFRRVVHNVRAAYPELLTQSFEVSQLYQQVVPYRLNRREIGVDSVEDYELALMQLLSGARGYLTGDADLQRALQDELESLNPDLSAYRGFATSRIGLAADAVRHIDQRPISQPTAAVGASASVAASSGVAARATERISAAGSGTPDSPRTASVGSGGSAGGGRGSSSPMTSHNQPSAAMPSSKSPGSPVSATSQGRAADAGAGAGDQSPSACRYCAGALPGGKSIVFCPYCGHDLTTQHCPACNTELEIGWRFCITCGRQVS